MLKVMFVCHGNICRSPMAEVIFRESAKNRGIDEIEVSSAAITSEEIFNGKGNPVHPGAEAELRKNGLTSEGKTAVLLRKEDYNKFDVFIGMDTENMRGMVKIFGSDTKGKIHKLSDYCDQISDVADPWYSGRFDLAYKDIFTGCEALAERIKKGYKFN